MSLDVDYQPENTSDAQGYVLPLNREQENLILPEKSVSHREGLPTHELFYPIFACIIMISVEVMIVVSGVFIWANIYILIITKK